MPFKFLSNGCSWYETHHLGGCIRRISPRPECTGLPGAAYSRHHRLAVIVPYRPPAMSGHQPLLPLSDLCWQLPQHLSRYRHLRFRIFVINQTDSMPFNRGALVNAGVRLLQRATPGQVAFDYLAIQDVDRFPVLTNESGCEELTSRYYSFPAENPRALNPESLAGGVLIMSTSLFYAVNGFSNQYWGWGEEDNDFFIRLRWCGLPPKHADALATCMVHKDCAACKRQKDALDKDALQQHQTRLFTRMPRPRPYMLSDGVSNLNFSVHGLNQRRCGGITITVAQIELHRAGA